MSYNQSEPPLRLEPRSSRRLALALLLFHGAAMVAVVNLVLPPWGLAALAGSVIVSLYYTINTHVLGRGPRAVCSLLWDSEGDWTLMSCGGERWEARLLPGSYVHPSLLVLNFALVERGHRAVVLLPDSLDPRTYRRLLVRLRLERLRDKDE